MKKFNTVSMLSDVDLENLAKNDPYEAEETRLRQIDILKCQKEGLLNHLVECIDVVSCINKQIVNIDNDINLLESKCFNELDNLKKLGFVLND